jgi:organic hydroperoxide reductase OsmC/OhrA
MRTLVGYPARAIARRLHDAAAEKCFIARSVPFKVKHEPTFEIASA